MILYLSPPLEEYMKKSKLYKTYDEYKVFIKGLELFDIKSSFLKVKLIYV